MYLFFDTETTGLPRSWNAPVTDTNNWPRLVQLAWQLYDAEGRKIDAKDIIVRPEGFVIPADASRVHGITTERARAEGIAITDALEEFAASLERAEHLVAHNMSFDEKIVGAEYLRNGDEDLIAPKKKICTMLSSVDFCAIPGARGGYKWPKLAELHRTLFGEDFAEAHNAAADINATARCFWELGRRGIITLSHTNTVVATKGAQMGLFG
jgi:DNA polymerase III subunit epsilon